MGRKAMDMMYISDPYAYQYPPPYKCDYYKNDYAAAVRGGSCTYTDGVNYMNNPYNYENVMNAANPMHPGFHRNGKAGRTKGKDTFPYNPPTRAGVGSRISLQGFSMKGFDLTEGIFIYLIGVKQN